jgi:hypothetical protein
VPSTEPRADGSLGLELEDTYNKESGSFSTDLDPTVRTDFPLQEDLRLETMELPKRADTLSATDDFTPVLEFVVTTFVLARFEMEPSGLMDFSGSLFLEHFGHCHFPIGMRFRT